MSKDWLLSSLLVSLLAATSLLISSLSSTMPPSANLGKEPWVFIWDKADLPTFLTESALTIYSPLDTIAGMLSDVAVPAPIIGPPVARFFNFFSLASFLLYCLIDSKESPAALSLFLFKSNAFFSTASATNFS